MTIYYEVPPPPKMQRAIDLQQRRRHPTEETADRPPTSGKDTLAGIVASVLLVWLAMLALRILSGHFP
jgi:hypothetical protein